MHGLYKSCYSFPLSPRHPSPPIRFDQSFHPYHMMGGEEDEDEKGGNDARGEANRREIQQLPSADAGSFLANLPSRIPSLSIPAGPLSKYIQGQLHSPKGIPVDAVVAVPPPTAPPNPVVAELCGSKRGGPNHHCSPPGPTSITAEPLTPRHDGQRAEEAVPEAARPTARPRLWTDSE